MQTPASAAVDSRWCKQLRLRKECRYSGRQNPCYKHLHYEQHLLMTGSQHDACISQVNQSVVGSSPPPAQKEERMCIRSVRHSCCRGKASFWMERQAKSRRKSRQRLNTLSPPHPLLRTWREKCLHYPILASPSSRCVIKCHADGLTGGSVLTREATLTTRYSQVRLSVLMKDMTPSPGTSIFGIRLKVSLSLSLCLFS